MTRCGEARASSGIRLTRFLLLLLGLSLGAFAQDKPPLPVDPTPLKDLLSAEERSLVLGVHGNVKLIDVYLDISDRHLQAAVSATEATDFSRAERELDIYNKAAAEASSIAFSGADKNKLGKRIEQR